MKRIALSLALILVASGSVFAAGSTGAWFSDTESSTGNIFTAGAIDLKIDNTSYYNGVANPGTSWVSTDLTNQKFFNFGDVKPGDTGEDTISLKVDNNDSYLCADVTLTTNKDNDCNTSENAPDAENGNCGVGDANSNGELASQVNFIWWADDGDNVLESDETPISDVGPIGSLAIGQPFKFALADSVTNIWTGVGGPVTGGDTYYIGKAWCFGTLTAAPLPQSTYSGPDNPANDDLDTTGAATPEDGGIWCNGVAVGNEAQTDSLTADVSFSAIQSRHNTTYICPVNNQCTFDSSANLVADGGFESPLVTTLPDNWDIFPSPAAGWNILWRDGAPISPTPRPAIANLELHRGVLGVAFEGSQYAELDSDWDGHANTFGNEPSATVIYQDIPTQVGAHYSLTYRFAPRPGTGPSDNDLEARLGGDLINDTGAVGGGGSNLVVGDWVLKGPFDFVATTTTTRLRFTDKGSTNNSLGTFIDDVHFTQQSCVN